jgi:hypothetical protein
MQGKMHGISEQRYLGVIAVVLRHRRWVKPAREFSLLYSRGRNTCDQRFTISGFSKQYDRVVLIKEASFGVSIHGHRIISEDVMIL